MDEDPTASGDPSSSPRRKCLCDFLVSNGCTRKNKLKDLPNLWPPSFHHDALVMRLPRADKDWRFSFMSESCCYVIVWVTGVNTHTNSVTTTRKFIRRWLKGQAGSQRSTWLYKKLWSNNPGRGWKYDPLVLFHRIYGDVIWLLTLLLHFENCSSP